MLKFKNMALFIQKSKAEIFSKALILKHKLTQIMAMISAAINRFLLRPSVQIILLICSLGLLMTWADERMYWPWMLAAYFIGLIFYFFERKKYPAGEQPGWRAYLFPKEVWLHSSAVHDYILSIINFFLIINILAPIALNPGFSAALVSKFMALFAHAKTTTVPPAGALVAYTISSVVLADLFYYLCHRLTHRIPILWEFHKVHHSAEVMTPVTVYRMHPVDLWLNQCFRALGLGIAGGVFLYFYNSVPAMLSVAGIDAGILVMSVTAANLRHSHIWISFGPAVERFLLSPALHQIHHSDNPKHFDKNYGSLLSVWDWMFGSLYLPQGREKITFGLGRRQRDPVNRSVWNLYATPVKKFYRWVIGS